jgi:hypothetical protein
VQLNGKKKYQEKLLSQLKNEEKLVKLEIDKQLQQIKSLEQLRKKIIADKEKYNAQQLASLNKIDRDIRKYKGKLAVASQRKDSKILWTSMES